MATLHVRNVPDELYERLKHLAKAQNRSLGAEVTTLLGQAVQAEENRPSQADLLARAQWFRESLKWDASYPDSTAMLREDRAR